MRHNIDWLMSYGSGDPESGVAFARERGLGLELTCFATGPGLNEEEARQGLEERYRRVLADFAGPLAMHGAFIDIALHSEDRAVAAVAEARIERDLATASLLGCRKIVFHLGHNPQITSPVYREAVVQRQAAFWPRMLEAWPELTICLENQWEEDWLIFREVFDLVRRPRFGMCLDLAHAHLHSQREAADWMRAMADQVRHMHWNDNMGDRDSHLAVGDGNIDWATVARLLHAWSGVTATLEMERPEAVDRSLVKLAQLGLYRAPD